MVPRQLHIMDRFTISVSCSRQQKRSKFFSRWLQGSDRAGQSLSHGWVLLDERILLVCFRVQARQATLQSSNCCPGRHYSACWRHSVPKRRSMDVSNRCVNRPGEEVLTETFPFWNVQLVQLPRGVCNEAIWCDSTCWINVNIRSLIKHISIERQNNHQTFDVMLTSNDAPLPSLSLSSISKSWLSVECVLRRRHDKKIREMFKTSSNSSGISSSESYGEILTNVSTASTLTNASRSAWVRVCQINLVL